MFIYLSFFQSTVIYLDKVDVGVVAIRDAVWIRRPWTRTRWNIPGQLKDLTCGKEKIESAVKIGGHTFLGTLTFGDLMTFPLKKKSIVQLVVKKEEKTADCSRKPAEWQSDP